MALSFQSGQYSGSIALRSGKKTGVMLIRVLPLICFLCISTAVFPQYISFHSIYVSTNIDSLETILKNEKEVYPQIKTLLSIEKSNSIWHPNLLSRHIALLESLCQSFPLMKGHLYYFKAKYEAIKHRNDTMFSWSQKAYSTYNLQKDTTGTIGALTLMGAASQDSQPKESSQYKYGQKYLLDAYNLSQKTRDSEAERMGINALFQYLDINAMPNEIPLGAQWKNIGISSTPQGPKKVYYLSPQESAAKSNQAPKTMPEKFSKSSLKGYSVSVYKINQKRIEKKTTPIIIDSLIKSGVINFMSKDKDIRLKILLGKEANILLLQDKKDNYKKNVKWNKIELKPTILTQKMPLELLLKSAITWGKRKDYELSIYYCQLALAHPEVRLPQKTSVLVTIMETYRLALKGLKRYEEMAVWSDSIYFYAEKSKKIENDAKISELIIQYETLKTEKQKTVLKQKLKAAKLQEQYYMKIGAFGILCLIGLGIFLKRLSSKNNRLQKAMHEIQTLNRTKDFFIGIIAHDLRRPLSSLQGMAEVVDFYIKTKRYDELKKISISIDRSGTKIRTLLDNTLYWVMSQEGRYQPESVNLLNEINSVLELYTQCILNQNIKLNIQCPTSLSVFADRNGLALILRNFIDNALKHMPTHGKLSIKASESPSARVQIVIEDNGKGITEAKLVEVRHILAHADELVPGQIGSSLGMLLVGRFVKINQGVIEVESQVDNGTVFTVTLPKAEFNTEYGKQTIYVGSPTRDIFM